MPDIDDEFFWDQLGSTLVLPVCADCGFVWLRPTPSCPRCASANVRTAPQRGAGSVYSWVVVHRALDPSFACDVPYTVLTVVLEAGARMVGRLLGDAPPFAGMLVELESWSSGGAVVPGFRPVEAQGAGP